MEEDEGEMLVIWRSRSKTARNRKRPAAAAGAASQGHRGRKPELQEAPSTGATLTKDPRRRARHHYQGILQWVVVLKVERQWHPLSDIGTVY